jgi:hypothetical protein
MVIEANNTLVQIKAEDEKKKIEKVCILCDAIVDN